MKKLAIAATALAALNIATTTKAHVPSQCSEYVSGINFLHHQIIYLIESRSRSGDPDLDDARRAMDYAISTLDDQIGRSRRTTDEMLSDTMSLLGAYQQAAIAFEDVATAQVEEINLGRKAVIMSLSLIRCIESH